MGTGSDTEPIMLTPTLAELDCVRSTCRSWTALRNTIDPPSARSTQVARRLSWVWRSDSGWKTLVASSVSSSARPFT